MSVTVYAGTDAGNGGAGWHPLHRGRDGWTVGEAHDGARNASFGTYSHCHDLYYLVDEQVAGALGVHRRDGDGWRQMAYVATEGAGPCYVALDAAHRHVAVAHYGSGSVALFRLDGRTGLPLGPPQRRQHAGSGPDRDRQEGPHAHCVRFDPDGRYLYHVDLGTDEIIALPIDPATGALGEPRVAFTAPAGSGPRHLVFHPVLPFAVLASELDSTLTILAVDDGILTPTHCRSTLPGDFAGRNIVGHLSLNRAGDRIYVTNRGHDSVAVFDWRPGAMPAPLQCRGSGGPSPRAFVLLEDERQFLLANEQGGNVTVFDLLDDGLLGSQTQDLRVPGAVFLMATGEAATLDRG